MRGHALVARDDKLASALGEQARRDARLERLSGQRATAGRTFATTSGWTGPTPAPRRKATSPRSPSCLVTGRSGHRRATLSLGFGASAGGGLEHRLLARAPRRLPHVLPAATPRAGTPTSAGWPRPRSAAGHRRLYDVSAMVLAGLEDKTYRGAGIVVAVDGLGLGDARRQLRAVPPRLVARPLPSGDRADRGRRPRGRGPLARLPVDAPAGRGRMLPAEQQPRRLAPLGRPAARRGRRPRPARLAARAHGCRRPGATSSARSAASSGRARRRRSAGRTPRGTRPRRSPPRSPRWSAPPRSRSATARAPPRPSYRAKADEWQRRGRGLDAHDQRPALLEALLPPPHDRRQRQRGHEYTIGDGGPTIDQRRVVDTSFLELVRLGVKPADDPDILSTLPVVDRELGVKTPRGQFWHRYNHDGYGETADGGPFPGPRQPGPAVAAARRRARRVRARGGRALGRAAGARRAATARLDSIAATASRGWMLPEQVWDDRRPRAARARPRHGTLSATPLAWTHAQFIRLAWSIDAGRPVERPGRRRVPLRQALLGSAARRRRSPGRASRGSAGGSPRRARTSRGGDLGDDRRRPSSPRPRLSSAALGVARAHAASSCAVREEDRRAVLAAEVKPWRFRVVGSWAAQKRSSSSRRRRPRGRRSLPPPRRGRYARRTPGGRSDGRCARPCSRRGRGHAVQAAELGLHAPETSRGEDRDLAHA